MRYNKKLYICKSVTGAPVGTLPTNTSYYMHITANGDLIMEYFGSIVKDDCAINTNGELVITVAD